MFYLKKLNCMQVKINKQIITLFQNTSLVNEHNDDIVAKDQDFLNHLISNFKLQYNGSGTKLKFREYVKKSVNTLTEILDTNEIEVHDDLLTLSEFVFEQTY